MSYFRILRERERRERDDYIQLRITKVAITVTYNVMT